MRLTLWFDGQPLGEVEFKPPTEQGLLLGTLQPNATYYTVRPRLQQHVLGLSGMRGASAEQIRAFLLRTQAELAGDGLMLRNAAGEPVPTTDLQVLDALPPETAPEVVEAIGVQVGAKLAPAT